MSPESNGGKLVENGGVDILVIFRVEGGEVAKKPFAKNYGKILSEGDQLEFRSNQFSGKLGGWNRCVVDF